MKFSTIINKYRSKYPSINIDLTYNYLGLQYINLSKMSSILKKTYKSTITVLEFDTEPDLLVVLDNKIKTLEKQIDKDEIYYNSLIPIWGENESNRANKE